MTSEITIEELSQAIERIFADLRAKGVSSVNIEEGGYLLVELADVLDVYGEPKLSVGDYDEDISLLRTEPKVSNVVSYNYIQSVAALIQYLAVRPLASKAVNSQ